MWKSLSKFYNPGWNPVHKNEKKTTLGPTVRVSAKWRRCTYIIQAWCSGHHEWRTTSRNTMSEAVGKPSAHWTRLVEDGSMVQAIKTTHTLPVMSFFGFHHFKVSQRIFWVKQMNNCVTKTHTKTHSQLHAIVTLNNDECFTAWSWMFLSVKSPYKVKVKHLNSSTPK